MVFASEKMAVLQLELYLQGGRSRVGGVRTKEPVLIGYPASSLAWRRKGEVGSAGR